MKMSQKDQEKVIWDQMWSSLGIPILGPGSQSRATLKLLSLTYIVYTLKIVSTSRVVCSDDNDPFTPLRISSSSSTGNTTTA
ncbi:hypothetical protein COP2_035445 [Malus domestica]